MNLDVLGLWFVDGLIPLFSVVAGVVFIIGFGLTLIRAVSMSALFKDDRRNDEHLA